MNLMPWVRVGLAVWPLRQLWLMVQWCACDWRSSMVDSPPNLTSGGATAVLHSGRESSKRAAQRQTTMTAPGR